jgi:ribosomal protein S18 acetylase RimI-like enzyme
LHSYSETYRVAALGNITTHPDFRGQGYAQQCTEALCRQLEKAVDLIGLNVRGDNVAAIHTYKKTGFEPVYEFSEMMLEQRPDNA